MTRFAFSLVFLCELAGVSFSQSAIEHHVWQDRRIFEPISQTAVSVTGPIRLSGNRDFALKGSKMTIAFGNGKPIALRSEGASWRKWDMDKGDKRTAEVFGLARDPGQLVRGNVLCGDPAKLPARHIVFFEVVFDGVSVLNVAVFSSKEPPQDIDSTGLCGTYTYAVD